MDKFNLDFKIMNSHEIFLLQKKFGIDVNPWNTVSKIITSMDFMRQEEISSRFEYASRERQKVGRKSWDVLVVDEAHNFAPKGTDSKRTTMLREISKWFEHRLFLTATPHNGYTRTFTGLFILFLFS